MKTATTLFLAAIMLLNVTGCAQTGNQNAATGAAIGAIAGTAIGVANHVPLAGAITGAVVGGLIGNAVDQNTAPQPPVIYPAQTEVVVQQAPVVVVETPVIIDERIWVGNDLWIYSYHGYRSPSGHVRYQSRVPFHRSFVHGGVGYRHR